MEVKILFSRYKIISSIGKGSFSVVYKAVDLAKETHSANENFVAIKVIDIDNPLLDQKVQASNSNDYAAQKKQLLREIEISKNVHHPNIVECFDVFHEKSADHDIYYIIMEYFPNGSLLDYLKKSGKCLTEQKACYFFSQMVAAVSYLHSKHIIHRDIKFENFVIVNSGQVKLIDFGFSIQSTPNFENDGYEEDYEIVYRNDHMRGIFCGSLAYSSPEIIVHTRYSYSIDIWSLGIVLFGMIFGKFPFQGQGEVLKNEILTSSTYFPKPISNELKNLINGMLRKNPKHRLTIEQVEHHEWLSKFNLQENAISENFTNNNMSNNGSIKNRSNFDMSNNIFINSNLNFLNSISVSQQQLPQAQKSSNNEDPNSIYQSEISTSLKNPQRNTTSALSLNPFLILNNTDIKRISSNKPTQILAHHKQSCFVNHQENFSMNRNDNCNVKSTEIDSDNIFLGEKKSVQDSPNLCESAKHPSISANLPSNPSKSMAHKLNCSQSVSNIKQKNPFIDVANEKDTDNKSVQTPSLFSVKGNENSKKSRFINTSVSLTFK